MFTVEREAETIPKVDQKTERLQRLKIGSCRSNLVTKMEPD